MNGLHTWPSRANFILFRLQNGEAGAVHAHLKSRGVLLKNVSGAHALLAQCLRVTVGAAAENRDFLAALESAINH
jgi:histidinol-phosphate aminotransferase